MSFLYITSATGFILLTIIFLILLLRLFKKAIHQSAWSDEKKKRIQSRILIVFFLWFLFISLASLSGFTSNFNLFPANFAPVLVLPFITIVIIVFSKNTSELLIHIPIREIIRLQVFRVFVEILLWMLFIQHALPVQMTFEGRNFDILAGLTAPLVSYFLAGNRKLLIVWNLLCLGLLINIVAIAILSMPTPIQVFYNEPADTIVTKFPFIFLPGFLVPLAYTLHFLSLRQLLSRKNIL